MAPNYRQRTQSFAPKKKTLRTPEGGERKINLTWFVVFFVLGLFLGAISIFMLSFGLIIRYYHMIAVMVAFGIISAAIHYPFLKKTPEYDRYIKKKWFMYLFYNVIGIGSIGLFTLLIFNRGLASNTIVHEYYDIVGKDDVYTDMSGVFLLEGDAFDYDPYWRRLPYKEFYKIKDFPVIEYDYYKGAFGFLVKIDSRLVKEKPSGE